MFLRAYVLVAVVHLILIYALPAESYLVAISKVALMPLLMTHVLMSGTDLRYILQKRLLILALIFSWGGDILLLDIIDRDNLFIWGLVSFMITHLLYIRLFAKDSKNWKALVFPLRLPIALGIVVWAVSFLSYIWPQLGDMTYPVLIYVLVIVMMALMALFRNYDLRHKHFYYVFAGALCFMVSDMFVALDMFVNAVEASGIIIMSTYICAQLLIAQGLLLEYRDSA